MQNKAFRNGLNRISQQTTMMMMTLQTPTMNCWAREIYVV